MDESAGKHRSRRIRKGAPWLKPVLVQSAWSAVKKKDSYLRARFQRLKARRGAMKAIVAIAAQLLRLAYHLLRHGTSYREAGASRFEERDVERAKVRHIAALRRIGFEVELRPAC